MIKHIVMWKLKDNAEGKTRGENARIMKSLFESLKNKIAAIKSFEVGIDIRGTASSYDVVLYSKFENEKALENYQAHPEHDKVAAFVGKVRESRIVVDYIV